MSKIVGGVPVYNSVDGIDIVLISDIKDYLYLMAEPEDLTEKGWKSKKIRNQAIKCWVNTYCGKFYKRATNLNIKRAVNKGLKVIVLKSIYI